MSWKIIRKKDYKGEPIQFVGYYVLTAQKLGLPQPEVFFIEDSQEKAEDAVIATKQAKLPVKVGQGGTN